MRQLILFLVMLQLFGCSKNTFDNEDDLMTYLKDEKNGYIQHKSVNGVDFTLMYRPTDLIVKQEIKEDSNSEEVIRLREKYEEYMYFNLSMSKNNQELLSVVPQNRNEFGSMVNQLVFEMDKKVHLFTQNKDTLEMIDFIYPRMYGISKNTTIMFVYPRKNKAMKSEYLNLTLQDLGLKTGEIKFKIPTKIINKEPVILFKD